MFTVTAKPTHRPLFALALALTVSLACRWGHPSAAAATTEVHTFGDVNGDGVQNLADVQCVLQLVAWSRAATVQAVPVPICAVGNIGYADLDCSLAINIIDAQIAVRLAVQGHLPSSLDTDGNGRTDTCEASCGDGVCTPEETCGACSKDCGDCASSCVASHETPGCSDANTQKCVCAILPACCKTNWGDDCVGMARASCSTSCCGPHGGTACSDADCAQCVCNADLSCCNESWKATCAIRAKNDCAAACHCNN